VGEIHQTPSDTMQTERRLRTVACNYLTTLTTYNQLIAEHSPPHKGLRRRAVSGMPMSTNPAMAKYPVNSADASGGKFGFRLSVTRRHQHREQTDFVHMNELPKRRDEVCRLRYGSSRGIGLQTVPIMQALRIRRELALFGLQSIRKHPRNL